MQCEPPLPRTSWGTCRTNLNIRSTEFDILAGSRGGGGQRDKKVIRRTSTGLGNIDTTRRLAPESSATGYIFPRRAAVEYACWDGALGSVRVGVRSLVVKASRVSEKMSRVRTCEKTPQVCLVCVQCGRVSESLDVPK